jgi:uncharacterized protein YjeT (DUF2065 family)
MQWSDLLAAFALYLVIEGVMPFLNPPLMKRVMLSFVQTSDRQLRISGLASMMVGLFLLFLVRA